jgi:hypothetical protein
VGIAPPSNASNVQNDLRFSSGLTHHFGGRRRRIQSDSAVKALSPGIDSTRDAGGISFHLSYKDLPPSIILVGFYQTSNFVEFANKSLIDGESKVGEANEALCAVVIIVRDLKNSAFAIETLCTKACYV